MNRPALSLPPISVLRPLLPAFWLLVLMLFLLPPPVQALSALDFPAAPPAESRVVDAAGVFSRAALGDVNRVLADFQRYGVEADVATLKRVDYGSTPQQVASDLLQRWGGNEPGKRLVVLLETGTSRAAIVPTAALAEQLPEDLLRSTAEDTIAPMLRAGDRYRRATVSGLERVAAVLAGGEDPGVQEVPTATAVPTNVPTRQQTAESRALIWVAGLLGLGTVIPMLTWWVFSR